MTYTTTNTATANNPTTANSGPGTVGASTRLADRILATIQKKTFCTLATTSEAGRPHSAGVVYEAVDGILWVHTTAGSRKARSIAASGHVGVCIPFRRLPVGPPYTIHFQATAELVAMDDPRVMELLAAGKLSTIAGHGALEMADGCFIAITPRGRVHSYGPGARIIDLIRDPLNNGANSFDYAEARSRAGRKDITS